ncbi:hypothetical protein [Fimbriiglobus ruber]|uniref:Uncharacterized protein n=1 Tax=Fimbriiglobus ruber TaxID=1908690 RepID=A0A225DLE5_9BACT|nr:hypothetical protein [Fimbriiglobus ruber]OWK42330.1 hypothetical protein FRUB_04408 [Fimbriiglobus ruber]
MFFAAGLVGITLSFGSVTAREQGLSLAGENVRARLTQRVQLALPNGWVVTSVDPETTPPDWHTLVRQRWVSPH